MAVMTCLITGACLLTLVSSSVDTSLRFLALGDWGGLPWPFFHTALEESCAHQMATTAQDRKTHFQLALGDNFYFDGVQAVDDKRFLETFEMVFNASSLQGLWYVVAGNHDHNGNVSAQIEYTKVSKRWHFPDYNYTFTLPIPGNHDATLQVVMIDTVLLCGNSGSDFESSSLPGPEDQEVAMSQLEWIETTLKQSKSDYVIVAGHYPVYSIAEHGPTKCLIDHIEPMLHKYRVTAYFSGHDHNLQHLQYTSMDWPVDYFVIGSANFKDSSTHHKDDVPNNALKFHYHETGGFAFAEASQLNMTFNFIDQYGKFLYEHVMYPRKV